MIHMQQLGVPESFVKMWGVPSWYLQYKVHTTFGVSQDYYQCQQDYFIHGPGKGNMGAMVANRRCICQ